MKRGLFAVCLVLLGASAVFAQEGEGAAPAPAAGVENLHAELGAGLMTMDGEDSTGHIYGALNYGFPIVDVVRFGGQIGGKATARNDDPDWLVSAGVFQREVAMGTLNTSWALQGIYQNTWDKADLVSVKPTLAVEINQYDYVALTGIWGLNDEHTKRCAGAVVRVQQPVDQAMVLWGAEWSDKFRTELGGGYAFQDIDSILLAAHAGMAIDDSTSLNVTGAFDFRGNYYTAVAVAFDMGATRRNATFNNVSRKTDSDYTPFPLGSLPVAMYQTQEGAAPAGAAPIIPPE